jgi:hypothetical protein
MNKIVIAGIAGLAIIALAVVGFIVMGDTSDKDAATVASDSPASAENNAKSTSENKNAKKACDLLSLEDAKILIGSNATLIEGSGSPNAATTADVKVDNCSYSADGATLGDMKQLLVQVHSGDSAQVAKAFDNYKKDYPGEALPDLGANAYYATETKQVNVLKGEHWFFVGAGSMNGEGAANKELAIKAAQTALRKL